MRFCTQGIAGLIVLFFCLCGIQAPCAETSPARALFVSVIQDPPVLSDSHSIKPLLDFAQKAHMRVLFVQIYHAGQAWYPSRVVDVAPYQKTHVRVDQDVFADLIRHAHRRGIEVHAWLNLLSLGVNTQAYFLRHYGTSILTQNVNPKSRLEDFKIDGQYFLEPGDLRVRHDLAKIVEEIVKRYPDLDGLQFDYIRYPDTKPHYGYTAVNKERFQKAYALKSIDENSEIWKDWKRRQVREALSDLINVARRLRPKIQISTTGCMPYIRAYAEAYQDWPEWLSSNLVDFVTIMDYSTDFQEFARWIRVIRSKTKDFSKVKVAVGAYKMLDIPAIFEKEFRACEAMGARTVVFHYGSILENARIKAFLERG